jgi:type I restriction enzyme S subunit
LFSTEGVKFLELEKLGKGIKPGLNRNEAYLEILSIPPLAEQKCIVAKVDKLMNLCDELETRLNQSKKDSEMLMQTVLHEAFS